MQIFGANERRVGYENGWEFSSDKSGLSRVRTAN